MATPFRRTSPEVPNMSSVFYCHRFIIYPGRVYDKTAPAYGSGLFV